MSLTTTSHPAPVAATPDGIKPYFFGEPSSQLFACYHAPRGGPSQHGVVLCYPIGHEYIRAHRVYRLLASRLARAGFHVLRFDYFGTGDSAGEFEEASLRRWRDDIAAAVEQLRGFGVRHVCLVGLRMGATLAMLVGTEHEGLAGIVLWDPVVNGSEYLAEVTALQQETLSSLGERASESTDGGLRELVGFPMTAAMVDEIERIDLLRVTRVPAAAALLVDSEEEAHQQPLRAHLESIGLHPQYEHVPNPRPWTQNPYKMLLPHSIVQTIVAWMSEQKR
jgi:exosortase A-associated hydrolase 2